MILKIYKCKKCNHEFFIIDDFAHCCIKCTNENLEVVKETTQYELYNHKTNMLVG